MEIDYSVKDLLYQELSKITEKKIQLDISKGQSSKSIDEIMSNCYPKILQVGGNVDENAGIFAESLMHYLLTIALFPSQRKVSQNNVEIDIIIPDLKILNSNPKDSIVIYFPKVANEVMIKHGILKLEKIQTVKENIWLVLRTDLQMKNRTYHIDNYGESFTKILDGITEFLSSRKQSKFKIIKS
ncbi:MAG: hypothetical protein ACREAJ_02145 [Nitrosopumilaceae archaeon]